MADQNAQVDPTRHESMLPGDAATATLSIAGATLSGALKGRTFSTGTVGYTLNGKVEGTDGERYQVDLKVYQVGSKDK